MSHHRQCCCEEETCACSNGVALDGCCCLDPSDPGYCGDDPEQCTLPCYFDDDGEPHPGKCTCPGTGTVIHDCCCNGTCGSATNYTSRCFNPCGGLPSTCPCEDDDDCDCATCPPIDTGAPIICSAYVWADTSLDTYDGSGIAIQMPGDPSGIGIGQINWYNHPGCTIAPVDLGDASVSCGGLCNYGGRHGQAEIRADSSGGCSASLVVNGTTPLCGGLPCTTCTGTDYTVARWQTGCYGSQHIVVPTNTAFAAGIKGFILRCQWGTACPEALGAFVGGGEVSGAEAVGGGGNPITRLRSWRARREAMAMREAA